MSNLPDILSKHLIVYLKLSNELRKLRSSAFGPSYLDDSDAMWLCEHPDTENFVAAYIKDWGTPEPNDMLYRYCMFRDQLVPLRAEVKKALRRLKDAGWRWLEKQEEESNE